MRADTPVDLPIPGTPQWNAQFGRGWVAGLIVFGLGFIVGVVPTAFVVDKVEQLRWLAAGLASFGGMFTFGISYIILNGIGFPWGTYVGDRLQRSGVLYPTTTPVKYFLVTRGLLALAVASVGAALFVWQHAPAVSEFMLSHATPRP